MPYRQRVAFMCCLILLGLGYLYAYVPAHYLAEYEPYAEIEEIDFDIGLEDEFALLGGEYAGVAAEDYTASALDALSGDELPQLDIASYAMFSAPGDGEEVSESPAEVILQFPTPIVAPSHLHIESSGMVSEDMHGEDYGEGDTVIDEDGVTMRRAMRQDAPDGSYLIRYKSCASEDACMISSVAFMLKRAY